MIVHMARVRLAGPRDGLQPMLALLQDLGALQLAPPSTAQRGLPPDGRERRHLQRLLDDVEAALQSLGAPALPRPPPAAPPALRTVARLARTVRRRLEALQREAAALADEEALLRRYREFFTALGPLLDHELTWPDGRAFYVVLRAGAAKAAGELARSLEAVAGRNFELLSHPLASGETAVLLLTSNAIAPKVSQLLAASQVQELPAPIGLGEANLLRARPALEARLAKLPLALATNRAAREALGGAYRAEFERVRGWLHDRLLVLEAQAQVVAGHHLFVLEGWLPQAALPALEQRVAQQLGPEVVLQRLASERWHRDDAPVTLRNPPLFRPFELITRSVPLPRYGSIDPTPFVAIFFPMFFGLMSGDVGYGAVLGCLAVALRLKSKSGTRLRSVAEIAGACAVFSILFGFLFGELFGSLGHKVGLRPLAFSREEATLPFLFVAIALGGVHILLGLVLGFINTWRHGERRAAMGRGVTALMLALSATALLAAFEVLPKALFTPFAIAVLVAFPVLIALEGIVAIVELLSTFGHVLSYARIMALGTASLMLAVVANRMVGAMGSVLVGVLFALLFHLVNFGLGLFSPTIHALRLHYVEFFGTFHSPGGREYRPLSHWSPSKQGG